MVQLDRLVRAQGLKVDSSVLGFFREVSTVELEWSLDHPQLAALSGSIQILDVPPVWAGRPDPVDWSGLLGVAMPMPLPTKGGSLYPFDYVRNDTTGAIGLLGGDDRVSDQLGLVDSGKVVSQLAPRFARYIENLLAAGGVLPQRTARRFPTSRETEPYWNSVAWLFPGVGPRTFAEDARR